MDELRACPFCGDIKSLRMHRFPVGTMRWIQCESCNAQGSTGSWDDDEAVELWNTRASDEVIRELVEALHNLTTRASYFGYGFALGHEMADADEALAKARQHLSNTQP